MAKSCFQEWELEPIQGSSNKLHSVGGWTSLLYDF